MLMTLIHILFLYQALSKAIDELVLEDALVEKVYGKQKVFVVPQVQSGYVNIFIILCRISCLVWMIRN